MYNFSGLIYQILACYLFIFLLMVLCILIKKPWSKDFKFKKIIVEILAIIFAVCEISVITYKIHHPDVLSYTGEFVETHRVSGIAPPLPFTYEYTFWNGEGKKQCYYLDSFSKDEIFPYKDLDTNKEYTGYYDDFTNVIVRIEECE